VSADTLTPLPFYPLTLKTPCLLAKKTIEFYKDEQRVCDIANIILRLFSDNQLTVDDTERVLDKVKKSIQIATGNVQINYGTAENEWATVEVIEEFKRKNT